MKQLAGSRRVIPRRPEPRERKCVDPDIVVVFIVIVLLRLS
jgi:hypothetical protein